MNLKYFREAMNVKRFHTESLIREDTIGHHSANVAGIIMYLYYPEIPSGNLLAAALCHDVAERTTGDIPATAKWECLGLKHELVNYELKVHQDKQIHVPDYILSNDELNMLKFADSVELGMKCMHEREMGNRTVEPIIDVIARYAESKLKHQPLDSRYREKAEDLIAKLI